MRASAFGKLLPLPGSLLEYRHGTKLRHGGAVHRANRDAPWSSQRVNFELSRRPAPARNKSGSGGFHFSLSGDENAKNASGGRQKKMTRPDGEIWAGRFDRRRGS